MHFSPAVSRVHETRRHAGFTYCWSQCQARAGARSTCVCGAQVCPCGCVRAPPHPTHADPQLFSVIAWDFCPHCSGHTSWFWENFQWDCPRSRQLALLILIAEKILDPHSPPSHSLLSVAESYSPGFYYAYPQIACFSLNRIRCLCTFQEYMRWSESWGLCVMKNKYRLCWHTDKLFRSKLCQWLAFWLQQ